MTARDHKSFVEAMMRKAARSLDVPYEEVTKEFEKVEYSRARERLNRVMSRPLRWPFLKPWIDPRKDPER